MKKAKISHHLPILMGIALLSISAAAAQASQGEFRGYYQHIANFDFQSGSPDFDITGDSFNGGGFGFVFNLNEWFGLYSESTFLTGVEQQGLDLKLFNQIQGAKLTAREVGPFNLYAKGGIGFTRFVFDSQGSEFVQYQTSFAGGGGVDILFSENFAIFVEGNLLSFSLPNLTGVENRDKWDSAFGTTVGVVLSF
jgi:hypothetical protein